jgi:hypothetical protein
MRKNPWTKKNPFLSMWLSGANAVAGTVRGHATRQVNAAKKRAATQVWDFWMGAPIKPVRTRRRRKR